MKVELGSIGIAAIAYVSHIAGYPSLCKFYLVAGIVGVVIGMVATFIAALVGDTKK